TTSETGEINRNQAGAGGSIITRMSIAPQNRHKTRQQNVACSPPRTPATKQPTRTPRPQPVITQTSEAGLACMKKSEAAGDFSAWVCSCSTVICWAATCSALSGGGNQACPIISIVPTVMTQNISSIKV